MDFELMLKQLDEIVNKLESGECGLDEATKLFEQGKNLALKCSTILDENKGKITEIVNELDGIKEKDFK